MKIYGRLVLILTLLGGAGAYAQSDLVGTWQGKLEVTPTEKITIQFVLSKKPDGAYKAVVNSPDFGGIKNVAADKVQFKNNRLTLEVPSLSGSYAGTLTNGAISGDWRQPGGALKLTLTRRQEMTAGATKPLLGSWVGKIKLNDSATLVLVLRFEMGKDGKIAGFLDIPDQNAKGLPVTDVNVEGSQVTFKIPVGKADYTGTLSGSTIAGGFKQGAQETKLNLTRGKYTPPPPEVNISAEGMKQLMGRWNGKIANLTVVFRFEKNAAGKYVVLMDSPDQKAKDIPVSSAVLTGDKLVLKLKIAAAEYNATLKGDKLDGSWKQGLGEPMPLVLTKQP